MLHELVRKNRSYRRFHADRPIDREALIRLVDTARLAPAGTNKQVLKYYVTADPDLCAGIFPLTKWGALLKGYAGPTPQERPTGYIVMLYDRTVVPEPEHFSIDVGVSAQTMLLTAIEQGIGGIMIGNIDRKALMELLGLDAERYKIALLVAFGYPAEEIILEDPGEDGSVAYYRDETGVHHVPKRTLGEVLLSK